MLFMASKVHRLLQSLLSTRSQENLVSQRTNMVRPHGDSIWASSPGFITRIIYEASTATAVRHLAAKAQQRPRCDKPACAVEGKGLLRRELIERGGSSEAWYGGPARRLNRLFQVCLALSGLHAGAPIALSA